MELESFAECGDTTRIVIPSAARDLLLPEGQIQQIPRAKPALGMTTYFRCVFFHCS